MFRVELYRIFGWRGEAVDRDIIGARMGAVQADVYAGYVEHVAAVGDPCAGDSGGGAAQRWGANESHGYGAHTFGFKPWAAGQVALDLGTPALSAKHQGTFGVVAVQEVCRVTYPAGRRVE